MYTKVKGDVWIFKFHCNPSFVNSNFSTHRKLSFFSYSTIQGSVDKGTNFHLAANKSKRSKGGQGIHFQDLHKKNDR